MPRALAVLLVLSLAACASEEELNAPLSPIMIRDDFYGHMMEAQAPDGTRTIYRFWRANTGQRIGETDEFIRWYADDTGLCLQSHDATPVCAPVYQLNVAHFRWGDQIFSDLTIRPGAGVGWGSGFGHGRGFPMW